jgi:hypothetical protein
MALRTQSFFNIFFLRRERGLHGVDEMDGAEGDEVGGGGWKMVASRADAPKKVHGSGCCRGLHQRTSTTSTIGQVPAVNRTGPSTTEQLQHPQSEDSQVAAKTVRHEFIPSVTAPDTVMGIAKVLR